MAPFISIEDIARRYPAASSSASPTTIFEHLWLSLERGEFGCIIGHSGCGKTTVLNILAGLDEPSEGAVIVDGQAIEGTSLDRAVIFQSHALAAVAHSPRQRQLRRVVEMAEMGSGQGQGACADLHRSCRPHGFGTEAAVGIVGRHETACRHRACVVDHAEDPADG